MIRRSFLLLALVLGLVPICQAEQRFLPPDCTALVELLPAPPEQDSIGGRADLETVLQVQAGRTPEQIRRAKQVANQTVTSFARPVLGDWFHSREFPQAMAIFAEIEKERRLIVDDQVKRRWNRSRPYLFSAAVHPVVDRPDNTSYPSGHASAAALWGTIFAAAFPEKAAEFQEQIRQAMWNRVVGGAHYPSDTIAGDMLGEAIGKKMLESPEMQEALITIRAELSPHLSHDSDTLQRGNAVDRKNPSGQTSGNGVGVLDAGGLGDQEKTSGPASTP